MSWDRNNLPPHALPSILCDSLSSSSAGLNLGRHLGRFGMFPMVAGNGPNTSLNIGRWESKPVIHNIELTLCCCRCAVQEGHTGVVALLLAKGASIQDKVRIIP